MCLLNNRLKKMLIYCLVLLLTSSQLSIVTFAKDTDNDQTDQSIAEVQANEGESSFLQEKYSTFLDKTKTKGYSGKEIVQNDLSKLAKKPEAIRTHDGKKVLTIEQGEETTLRVHAPEIALYYVGLHYTTDEKNVLPAQVEMKVNGDVPYSELRNLVLESRWENPEEIKKDKYGNEIVPQPIKVNEWLIKFVNDSSNRSSDPLFIELQKGEN